MKSPVIAAVILSTVLFSCASRKNKRSAKELKSPSVELEVAESDEAKAAQKAEKELVPIDQQTIVAEKHIVQEKKPVVEIPLRVELPAVDREFRGAWVATVANINWPTKGNYSTEAQKREAIQLLD